MIQTPNNYYKEEFKTYYNYSEQDIKFIQNLISKLNNQYGHNITLYTDNLKTGNDVWIYTNNGIKHKIGKLINIKQDINVQNRYFIQTDIGGDFIFEVIIQIKPKKQTKENFSFIHNIALTKFHHSIENLLKKLKLKNNGRPKALFTSEINEDFQSIVNYIIKFGYYEIENLKNIEINTQYNEIKKISDENNQIRALRKLYTKMANIIIKNLS